MKASATVSRMLPPFMPGPSGGLCVWRRRGVGGGANGETDRNEGGLVAAAPCLVLPPAMAGAACDPRLS